MRTFLWFQEPELQKLKELLKKPKWVKKFLIAFLYLKKSNMINSTKEWNWIYESPDGGATVTRRPFMSQDNSEKIQQ